MVRILRTATSVHTKLHLLLWWRRTILMLTYTSVVLWTLLVLARYSMARSQVSRYSTVPFQKKRLLLSPLTLLSQSPNSRLSKSQATLQQRLLRSSRLSQSHSTMRLRVHSIWWHLARFISAQRATDVHSLLRVMFLQLLHSTQSQLRAIMLSLSQRVS